MWSRFFHTYELVLLWSSLSHKIYCSRCRLSFLSTRNDVNNISWRNRSQQRVRVELRILLNESFMWEKVSIRRSFAQFCVLFEMIYIVDEITLSSSFQIVYISCVDVEMLCFFSSIIEICVFCRTLFWS